MKKYVLFLSLIFLSLPVIRLTAQQTADPVAGHARHYLDSALNQATLYHGRTQTPMVRNIQSMYLRNRGFREINNWGNEIYPLPVPDIETYGNGSLLYDGIFYPDVNLRLDLYADDLMILTPNRVYNVRLDPAKVEYADFFDYRVFYIPENSPEFNLLQGYYLLLNTGPHRILKKESYQFNPSEYKFVNRSIKYYIEMGGEFLRVKNRKNSVLKVLRKHRRELEHFIRENQINVKRDTENAILLLVSEYDKLNKADSL